MPTATKKKSTKRLLLLLLAGLFPAIILMASFYSTRSEQTAFFARSINDASYDCEDKISSRFDESLVSKYYDNISSRYEQSRHQYIIYYRISVREDVDELPVITDYLAKCIVWERVGYVSDFTVLDI